jgi:hypothetical protein
MGKHITSPLGVIQCVLYCNYELYDDEMKRINELNSMKIQGVSNANILSW